MDYNPAYIKMCEMAGEIQMVAPREGYPLTDSIDYPDGFSALFYLTNEKSIALLHYDNDEGHWMIGGYHQDTTNAIWLPRQDQLQEMLYGRDYKTKMGNITIPEKTDMWSVMPSFIKWAYNWDFKDDSVNLTRGHQFTSMEQLWLAFVMRERFNKTWNRNEWVTS